MRKVQLNAAQQQELKKYIDDLKAMRKQAQGGQPVDFGHMPRIVANVCTYMVTLTPQQLVDLDELITDLQDIETQSAAGRPVTLYRSVRPAAEVCGPNNG